MLFGWQSLEYGWASIALSIVLMLVDNLIPVAVITLFAPLLENSYISLKDKYNQSARSISFAFIAV